MLSTLLKLIPKHRIYLELFGGSAKLLLNKEPSKIEVYNDYSKQIANLFYVATFKFDEFYEKINRIVYSRAIFDEIADEVINVEIEELGDVDLAVKTYFKLYASYSGLLESKFFKQTYTRQSAKQFFNNLELLRVIHDRLKNVIIESLDFRKLLNKYKDIEDAFIYLDPPYFNLNYYRAKFTIEDHKDMLNILKSTKAKWLLSGYANDLYDDELKDFYRVEIPVVKHSKILNENTKKINNSKDKVLEILWANYDIKELLNEA